MADKHRVERSMEHRAVSDTPLHNAERVIHIFFNEAGEARPAQIVRKSPIGKELICWKCGVNSRPMPEGATHETQFICASCSPLGIVCGGQLDRCAFDNWAIPERWRIEDDLQFSFRDLVEYFVGHSEDVASVPSSRVLFYRQNGEAWAVNTTPKRVAALGKQERACFVAFYWAGMSSKEIAESLGITSQRVLDSLADTRNKLSKTTM